MGSRRSALTFSATALICSAFGLLAPSSAQAATEEEKAGARAAATQGQSAFEAKHWAEALDLFTRAESLVHSPVHLLYKARALVQLGQLVKARETYLTITREETPSPSPAVTKAKDAAAKELPALEPRLANLTVKVEGPGAADATVTMDGAKVSSALIGLARPADPGQHTLLASTPSAQSEPQTITLKEGGTLSVTLQLKAIPGATPAPGPSAPSAQPVASPPMASGSVDAGSATHSGNTMRTASYVALGAGAVGLAAGALFGLKAKNKYKDANALCKGQDPCTLSQSSADRREQLGKDGDSAKTVSLVGFIVGGAGVAAGATLFILSSGKQTEPAHAGVTPWIGLGSIGLDGRF